MVNVNLFIVVRSSRHELFEFTLKEEAGMTDHAQTTSRDFSFSAARNIRALQF